MELYICFHCKFWSLCRQNISKYYVWQSVCVCVRFFFHFIRLHKLCIFEMHTLLHSLNFLWHAVFLVIVFRTFLHIAYAFGHTIIGLLVLLYAKIKNLKHAWHSYIFVHYLFAPHSSPLRRFSSVPHSMFTVCEWCDCSLTADIIFDLLNVYCTGNFHG